MSLLSCEQPLCLLGRRACQATDTLQEGREQRLGNGDLRHLEDRPPGVTYHLGTYLYELQLYAGKGPVGHLARQSKAPEEVSHVVSQYEQREPHLVGGWINALAIVLVVCLVSRPAKGALIVVPDTVRPPGPHGAVEDRPGQVFHGAVPLPGQVLPAY